MFTRVLAVIILMAAFSATASVAQQWSAEQQEVWQTVEALWDAADCETWSAFFADDYRGWFSASLSPLTKQQTTASGCRYYAKEKTVLHTVHPLAIDVRDDIAIVFYSYSYVSEKKSDGSERQERGKWTEVYQKRDGSWLLIADAGWLIP